jgi:hypothetical protein
MQMEFFASRKLHILEIAPLCRACITCFNRVQEIIFQGTPAFLDLLVLLIVVLMNLFSTR